MQRYRVETDRAVPGIRPNLIKYDPKSKVPQIVFIYYAMTRDQVAAILATMPEVMVH